MNSKENKKSNTSSKVGYGLLGAAIGVAGYFLVDHFFSNSKKDSNSYQSAQPERQRVQVTSNSNNTNSNSKIEEKNTDTEIESFLCPISMEIMKDPVITPDGITFDRQSILDWLEKNNYCPLTKNPLEKHQLIPNRNLKEAIEKYKSFKQN